MELIQIIFPFSFRAKKLNPLIGSIVVYMIIGVIGGLILGLLRSLPLVGTLFGVVGTILDIYTVVGIVLSFLVYCKILS